jgi:hypothetical protein
MLQCSKCKDKFPDDLVQSLCANGDYISVCGVCALAIIRELHRIPSYEFCKGSIARDIHDKTKRLKEITCLD